MSIDAMGIDKILSQMRVLQAKAAGQLPIAEAVPQTNFASTLQNTLNNVNDMQVNAAGLQEAFENGDSNVSIAQVMIASKKAELGLQATVQVRNKLVQAYKEIMDMPV